MRSASPTLLRKPPEDCGLLDAGLAVKFTDCPVELQLHEINRDNAQQGKPANPSENVRIEDVQQQGDSRQKYRSP